MTIQEKAKLIRLAVTGSIISNYAMIQLQDDSRFELKKRVNNVLKSCMELERYFITHEDCKAETRSLFREQFNSNELALLSELLKTCMVLDESGIEEVISAIKTAIEPV